MTTPTRIYDANVMASIANFFEEFEALCQKHFPEHVECPVYIYGGELVLRHKDQYTIGRLGIDDFWFFEITDETYGETK